MRDGTWHDQPFNRGGAVSAGAVLHFFLIDYWIVAFKGVHPCGQVRRPLFGHERGRLFPDGDGVSRLEGVQPRGKVGWPVFRYGGGRLPSDWNRIATLHRIDAWRRCGRLSVTTCRIANLFLCNYIVTLCGVQIWRWPLSHDCRDMHKGKAGEQCPQYGQENSSLRMRTGHDCQLYLLTKQRISIAYTPASFLPHLRLFVKYLIVHLETRSAIEMNNGTSLGTVAKLVAMMRTEAKSSRPRRPRGCPMRMDSRS